MKLFSDIHTCGMNHAYMHSYTHIMYNNKQIGSSKDDGDDEQN